MIWDGRSEATRVADTRGVTPAGFRSVFADREFGALWLAYLLSVAGDQLALVALTVLVFDRTHSPLLTAATYAVSFLPWLAGGLFLAHLADRFPRRRVMIGCDLTRTVLAAAMVTPRLALWALIVLLFAITLLDSPFRSARAALMADVLAGDRYALGTAITQTTGQAGRVAGFAAGGVVVALLGARPALAIDAATFAFSAAVIAAGVRRCAAPADAAGPASGAWLGAGVGLVFRDAELRSLMLLGWLVPFYATPEALAVPFANRLGGGAAGAGLVFAALPFGAVVGSLAFARLAAPAVRLRWMGALAVSCCAVLGLCLLHPGLAVSLVIFAVSGTLTCYQIAANAAFVAAVPAGRRGQAFGVANAGIRVGQGAWFVVAGTAATTLGPATVIAASGIVGAGVAAFVAASRRRVVRSAG